MSEWAALLALAYALYLLECLAWIDSSGCACFVHPLRSVWRCATGDHLPGNERGGLALVSPAHLTGALVISRPWPFSVSPDGITTVVTGVATSVTGEDQYVAFDAIESVTTDPTGIRIDGKTFVRVSSTAVALHLAEQIESLRQESAHKRGSQIKAMMRRSLDGDRAAASWTTFQRRTRALFLSSSLLFGYVFGVVPLVLFVVGPYPSWQYLLAGLVLATAAIAFGYRRAHASLYPQCRGERWLHILSMILLPVAAIRALDKLSRDALCEFSPVAVVPLLCGSDIAVPLLRQYVIDLATPATGAEPADRSDTACAEWYRQTLAKEIDTALESLKPLLLAPPARDEASMASYCPRCHAQFSSDGRDCADCPGVALIPFAPHA